MHIYIYIYIRAGTSAAHILLKNANFPQFYSKNDSKHLSYIDNFLHVFPEYPEFPINFWRMFGSGQKSPVVGEILRLFFENLLLAGEM